MTTLKVKYIKRNGGIIMENLNYTYLIKKVNSLKINLKLVHLNIGEMGYIEYDFV